MHGWVAAGWALAAQVASSSRPNAGASSSNEAHAHAAACGRHLASERLVNVCHDGLDVLR